MGIAKDQTQRQGRDHQTPVAVCREGRAGADKSARDKRQQRPSRLNAHQEGDHTGHHIAEDLHLLAPARYRG